MYCVIQEIQLKKPKHKGEWKEYIVTKSKFTINGKIKHHYGYYHNEETGRFERTHCEAYRITLHHSYREDGKVRKRQYSIDTVDYYTLAEGFWTTYDLVSSGVERAAAASGMDFGTLYDLVENRVKKLRARIRREWHKTPEHLAKREQDALRKNYEMDRKRFAQQYGVDKSEYDYVYDFYGNLRDKAYLNFIIRQREVSQRAHERSYYESFNHNYTYTAPASSTFDDNERAMLKDIYRVLSRKYHPDANPDTDTTTQMQLINKLKTIWEI